MNISSRLRRLPTDSKFPPVSSLRLSVGWIIGILVCTLVFGVLFWSAQAGATTVFRIVAYNVSGIEDYQIFPQRVMNPSPSPRPLEKHIRPAMASTKVAISDNKNLILSSLLEANKTTAFLVIKDNILVYENYFQGYNRQTPSMSFSVSKSILSLLVGCALDDGFIHSLDQPVTDFIPELVENGFDAVTLRHLLQMTSGVNYIENDFPFGIHPRLYYSDRLEEEILGLKTSGPSGAGFVYKSADAFLLSLALDRALGDTTITEYMQNRIWYPLGMEDEGIWSVDHEPDGLEKTGCCLTATARDFAKMGLLYLNHGSWFGAQIVSKSWIDESTKMDSHAEGAWEYRYMWWRVSPTRPDYMAVGHLGQFIYVNPAAEAVVVRLGEGLGDLSRAEWVNLFMSLSDSLKD